jgi:hypothetical protein
MIKTLQILALFFTILGSFIIIVFLRKASIDGFSVSNILPTNYEVTGQFGDFIGGVVGTFFALAGTFLIFLSFIQQANENKRIAFESSFFEMIRIHRENINEMRYYKFRKGEEKIFENRQVINIIFKEFIECYREVKKFSNSQKINDYINPKHEKKLKLIASEINPKINLIELALIDISWSIVFYGLSVEGESVIRKSFKRKYNPNYYYRLLYYIKLKPKKSNLDRFTNWTILRNLPLNQLLPLIDELYFNRIHPERTENLSQNAKNLKNHLEYEKYYGGHQFRLGHYFRHLFQSYKFLNSQAHMKDQQKYFYGKLLRAQLSTYEQALLFINSLSSLGMNWEYNPEKESNTKIITKYNLIKNLSDTHMYGIKYKTYYKNVIYEFDEQLKR